MNDGAVRPTKKSAGLIAAMAARSNLEPEKYWATLKATIFPKDRDTGRCLVTDEEAIVFLVNAHHHDLDPLKGEIVCFAKKGGGVQSMVTIDGWIKVMNQQPEMDGVEYEYDFDEKGRMVAVTCVLYRRDRNRPTKVTEYLDECSRPTDPWRTMPKRMLRHKATMQAVRIAFGLTGLADEDDIERMRDAGVIDVGARTAEAKARLQVNPSPDTPAGEAAKPTTPPEGAEEPPKPAAKKRKRSTKKKPADPTPAPEPSGATGAVTAFQDLQHELSFALDNLDDAALAEFAEEYITRAGEAAQDEEISPQQLQELVGMLSNRMAAEAAP